MSRMVFSPDGEMLAISRPSHVLGSKIILNDVPAEKLRQTLEIAKGDGTGRTLIFSPDSKTLAARADAINMGLWHTTTGQRIGSVPLSRGWKLLSFAGHNFAGAMPAFLDSAAFFPDGRSLVVDMDDGTAEEGKRRVE